MKILFLYAHRTLGTFAEPDVGILRERHEVDVLAFASRSDMLRAAARAARADLLFCWFGSARYLPAILVARLLRKPVVVLAGGYDVANEPAIGYGNMRPGAGRALGRLLFRFATAVVPFSQASAVEAQRNAGVPPEKMRVAYLGFDPPQGSEQTAAKERMVVTIAVLNPSSILRKGILTLVRASRLLSDVPIVIAGGGDEATMRALRSEAGPNVTFTGFVDDATRDDLLRRARVYAQPSQHEGFGAAVAEAMQFDCVPVVSRRGSLPEVVGPHGRFVEPDDPQALASAIRAALAEPDGAGRRDWIRTQFPMRARRDALLALIDDVERGTFPAHS